MSGSARQVLAVLAVLAASPVAAQTTMPATAPTDALVERAIVFQGTAPNSCIIRALSSTSEVNATLTQAANGVAVNLTTGGFVDPRTGVPRETAITLSLPIICNAAHRVRIASRGGALRRVGITPSAGAGAFRSAINFRVDLDWADATRSFDTGSLGALEMPVPSAASGLATIRITIPGGGEPLAAGDYSDTLVVEVEASS